MGRKGRSGGRGRAGRGTRAAGGRQAGGRGGGLGRLAGGAADLLGGIGGGPGGGPGGQTGTFRVDRFGNITKVSVKKRKKSYRMPRVIADLVRSTIEQNRATSQAVILAAIGGHRA